MGNNTATITPDAQTISTGELLHLDPAELVLEDNVRTDPVLGKDFIESVATGVRLPLYAVRRRRWHRQGARRPTPHARRP